MSVATRPLSKMSLSELHAERARFETKASKADEVTRLRLLCWVKVVVSYIERAEAKIEAENKKNSRRKKWK